MLVILIINNGGRNLLRGKPSRFLYSGPFACLIPVTNRVNVHPCTYRCKHKYITLLQ